MRVAVAVQDLEKSGGKERDALAVAGGLAARGHEVVLLTRAITQQRLPPGVTVRTVDLPGQTNHAKARNFSRALAGLRAAGEFDRVLAFEKTGHADAYYAADVCFAPRCRGFRAFLPRYRTYARLEQECMAANGPEILFLCRAQAEDYRRFYPIDAARSRILPPMLHDNGSREFYARRSELRRQLRIPLDALLAVSVAVYPEQKGMDRSIEALSKIPSLWLLCVGMRDAVPIQALTTRHAVSDRIVTLGYRNDVHDLIGAADLMLHPARVESAGLVILESLLAGVPVVVTANCGHAEYVERFGAGTVLAEPFNQEGYVKAITAALEPDRLSELRARARDSAPILRAEGGLDRIIDVIEDALAK